MPLNINLHELRGERESREHMLIETPEGKVWQCLKCGFLVEPNMKGHRCTESSEMYTEKPENY